MSRLSRNDIWYLTTSTGLDLPKAFEAFTFYNAKNGTVITRDDFIRNLSDKFTDRQFREDISPLLALGTLYDFDKASHLVMMYIQEYL